MPAGRCVHGARACGVAAGTTSAVVLVVPSLELALWIASLAGAAGRPIDLDALGDLLEMLAAVEPTIARA